MNNKWDWLIAIIVFIVLALVFFGLWVSLIPPIVTPPPTLEIRPTPTHPEPIITPALPKAGYPPK